MTSRRRTRSFLPIAAVAMALLALPAYAAEVPAQLPDPNGRPLKVYILAGQSNMQGRARFSTIPHMGMDPKTAPMLKKMVNEDGTSRLLDKVWIAALGVGKYKKQKTGKLTAGFGYDGGGGTKIGPEFTFGIYMQKYVKEPILIIKTTWGGKSLNTDFRPPSAGPYEFGAGAKDITNPDELLKRRREAAGQYYQKMIDYVKQVLANIKGDYPDYDPDQGHEVAGFMWFQGVHDFGDLATYPNAGKPASYDEYSRLLACLIRDVRKDLNAPKMPFVIGTLGRHGDCKHLNDLAPRQNLWVK